MNIHDNNAYAQYRKSADNNNNNLKTLCAFPFSNVQGYRSGQMLELCETSCAQCPVTACSDDHEKQRDDHCDG